MTQIANVILPINSDISFSYLVPEGCEIKIGQIVSVPFRTGIAIGVVIETTEDISVMQLKTINYILPEPYLVPIGMIELWKRLANYTMTPLGMVARMSLSFLIGGEKDLHKIEVSLMKIKPIMQTMATPQLSQLNDGQQIAYEQIVNYGHENIILLDGVTGSGKTEVYFHLAAKILSEPEGSVLILLPEIALTEQIISRISTSLGQAIGIFHADITKKAKRDLWHRLLTGEIRAVVGARSSLMLPLPNLRLIVVDEEHDQSYKQEEGVIYNARDMAVMRGKIDGARVILSSATPSLESYSNAKNGRYKVVKLDARHGALAMPEIHLIDLSRQRLARGRFMSSTLSAKISAAFAAGDQAMLYLNRRGYAPMLICNSCGYRLECPDCDVTLTYHKKLNKLACHYCGYNKPVSRTCPLCFAEEKLEHGMAEWGPGVERLEEEVKELLPKARTMIVTSDTVNTLSKITEAVHAITDGKVDVVIGTQIIAKGHNFPNLQLVGVIDGDSMMGGEDFRAFERSYQLLSQVSGRAGRARGGSEVIVQSHLSPETQFKTGSLFAALKHGMKEEFLTEELEQRRIMKMPPFYRLASIIISGLNLNEVTEASYNLLQAMPEPNFTNNEYFHALGPADCIIPRLGNRYRKRLLIKMDKRLNLQKLIKDVITTGRLNKKIMIKVDIDPYSFF